MSRERTGEKRDRGERRADECRGENRQERRGYEERRRGQDEVRRLGALISLVFASVLCAFLRRALAGRYL
eukprot:887561-Pyramimonas_sp.AAC.1